MPEMDRQNSTTPLVNHLGMNRSLTAAELAQELNKQNVVSTSLKRKNSQVGPMNEKELEAKHTLDEPTSKPKDSCGKYTIKVIVAILVGIYFGWFLQKSSGKAHVVTIPHSSNC